MRYYLETSAAAKLLVEEPESAALAAWADDEGVELVATHLVETELRRFAARQGLPQTGATEVLDRLDRYGVPSSSFTHAGLIPGRWLRLSDTLHLAGAIRLEVAAIVSYDDRLAAGADALGLRVLAPR